MFAIDSAINEMPREQGLMTERRIGDLLDFYLNKRCRRDLHALYVSDTLYCSQFASSKVRQ